MKGLITAFLRRPARGIPENRIGQQSTARQIVASTPESIDNPFRATHGKHISPVGIGIVGIVGPFGVPQGSVVVQDRALDDLCIVRHVAGHKGVPDVVDVHVQKRLEVVFVLQCLVDLIAHKRICLGLEVLEHTAECF